MKQRRGNPASSLKPGTRKAVLHGARPLIGLAHQGVLAERNPENALLSEPDWFEVNGRRIANPGYPEIPPGRDESGGKKAPVSRR
jgi:hypothetical protein